MKLPDTEQFKFNECEIAGDKCWLIIPTDMSTKWDDDNFRFRSCIVRQRDNTVISQGFGKFTNFGERPDFQPWDNDAPFEARHKIDGSLLIVSKHKGELITRTRGTIDARTMANGHEIDLLIAKYPKAFKNNWLDGENCSLLYEWTTPSNIIVIREHDEPTLTLVGMVEHYEPKYATQEMLDYIGYIIEVDRPKKYVYNSIAECIADVAAWTGKEGVVISQGQVMKKIKGDEYCELHKMATGITGINTVLDVFMASPRFTKTEDFYKYIECTLDYEIAEKCKEYIDRICKAYTSYLAKIDLIKRVVEQVRLLETRKEQALEIQLRFKGIDVQHAFIYLDNREVEDKLVVKALEELIKI